MSKIIKVVVAPPPAVPGEKVQLAYITTCSADLEGFRLLVGGPIEVVPAPWRDVKVYCHEEGLLENLPWNRALFGVPLAGTLVFYGGVDDEGFEQGLDDKTANALVKFLNRPSFADQMWLLGTPSSMTEFEKLTGRPAIEIKEMP